MQLFIYLFFHFARTSFAQLESMHDDNDGWVFFFSNLFALIFSIVYVAFSTLFVKNTSSMLQMDNFCNKLKTNRNEKEKNRLVNIYVILYGLSMATVCKFFVIVKKSQSFYFEYCLLVYFLLFKMNGKLNYTVCESTLKMQPNDSLVANEFPTIRPFSSVLKL